MIFKEFKETFEINFPITKHFQRSTNKKKKLKHDSLCYNKVLCKKKK